MNMANCYDRLFQMEEAEEAYRMASNLDPDNDEVYLEWGIFYYNQERFEAALACYEQALRLNPHNDIALQYQCDSLVMIEHYEEAAEVAESLTLCHPDDWQTWYNRAWCCERLEQYGEVMTAAQKVIQLYPENKDGYELLGNAQLNTWMLDEALENYDKTLELCPTNWQVWGNKGLCLFRLKRYDEALECYDIATIGEPVNPEWWNSKGFMLSKLDRLDEAMECYRKAIDLYPDFAMAIGNMADVYQKRKDFGKAVELYMRAYALDPEHRCVELFSATWCMFRMQRYDEMVPHLISLLPYAKEEEMHVAYRLGVVYKQMGQYQQAIDYFKLDLDTFCDDPDNNACWLNIAICEEMLEHYDKAEAAWKRSLEDITDDDYKAFCLYGLGLMYGKQERYSEAMSCFEQALALDPDLDDCREALKKAQRLSKRKTHE